MPLTYETKIGCGNSLHAYTHNILVVIVILCVSHYSSRTDTYTGCLRTLLMYWCRLRYWC